MNERRMSRLMKMSQVRLFLLIRSTWPVSEISWYFFRASFRLSEDHGQSR